MGKEYLTKSPTQTQKLGEQLAKEILKKKVPLPPARGGRKGKKAFVVALEGELGSGKTTFLQGFAKGLGIREKILSPTFVILKKFRLPSPKFQWFYHIDCYRIEKAKELLILGFKEVISEPQNIVVIEWAEKIKKILPENILKIKFKFVDEKKRKIKIAGLLFRDMLE